MIQAYPLPSTAGLTNNQFTNPVLGQNNDTGDGRIDWNLNTNNTIFGRFSRQDTLTNTPSTFGFRNVPGLSVPVSLGNNTTYAGRAPMSNYNAVLAYTHVFSSTFLVDMRMGYTRFAMRNVDSTAPTSGPGLGQMLGVPNSNQEPESLGFPIYCDYGVHRNRRPRGDTHHPLREHIQSHYQLHQDVGPAHTQMGRQLGSAPDYRLPG